MSFAARRDTVTTWIGPVPMGSAFPIVVQSMTNTDTADAAGDRRAGRGAGRGGLADSFASR